MFRIIILFLLSIIAISIFYFSWIPDPVFKNIDFLPDELGFWADKYINIRTSIPFFFLGFLARIIIVKSFFFYFNIFIVITLICEIGQLFMPQRHFDTLDIFWGVFGGIIGLILAITFNFLLAKIRNNY